VVIVFIFRDEQKQYKAAKDGTFPRCRFDTKTEGKTNGFITVFVTSLCAIAYFLIWLKSKKLKIKLSE